MPEDTTLSRDRVFDILSSPRRRYALHYLRTERSPIELTDLAEEVAAWENDTTVAELSSQDRKRVYVSLYQTHVPKLAEAGLVEYDADSGEVRLTDQTAEIDPFIGDRETEPQWYRYYLALALVNLALLVGVTVGVPPLGAIGLTAVAVVIVGSLLALTAIHAVYNRRQRDEVPTEFEKR